MRPAFASLVFVSLLLFSAPVFAAPRIQARLSQNQISASETAVFSLQAEWPRQEAQYQFAFPELPLENLTLVNQGQSQEIYPGEGGEWNRKIFTFELKPVKTGPASVKSFTLSYVDPQQEKNGNFEVQAQPITVFKPGLSNGIMRWSMVGAAILAVFVLAVTTLMGRAKKSRIEIQPLSPARIAADEFKKLLEQQDVSNDSIPQLNRYLRIFLTEMYKIPAAASTETEISRNLETAGVPKEDRGVIQNILTELEEIKYVGNATEAEFLRLKNDLLRFIHSKQLTL